MVWEETCAVDERMRFVLAVEAGEEAVAALCRRFGISRRVGYKWLSRYRAAGVAGLADRSRAPLCTRRRRDGDRRALPRGPASESELGSGEGPCLAGAARAEGGLAGGEHHRHPVRPRGPDGQAAAPAWRAAGERAVRRLRGGQRRVVHRLQGLVPDRRTARCVGRRGDAAPRRSAREGRARSLHHVRGTRAAPLAKQGPIRPRQPSVGRSGPDGQRRAQYALRPA